MKLIFFKKHTKPLNKPLILPSDIADVMEKYKINFHGLSGQNHLMIYCILKNKASLLAETLETLNCDTSLKFSATTSGTSISMKFDAYELARELEKKFNDTSCIDIISKHRAEKCALLKSRFNGGDRGNEFYPPA